MNSLIVCVFKKELKDALRDKRALTMLALFIFLFPLMMVVAIDHAIDKATNADTEKNLLVVIGAGQAPNLIKKFKDNSVQIELREDLDEIQITEMLKERKVTAILKLAPDFTHKYMELKPAPAELWFDSAADLDSKTRRIQNILRAYNADIAQTRLQIRGISSALLSPVAIQEFDTATNSTRSGKFVGVMLGTLFVYVFYYCFNTTIDSTAGERERKSLETLLAQPIWPFDIIAGKWLACSVLSMVGLCLALLAGHLALKSLPLEEIGISWRLGWGSLLGLMLAAMPLCLFAPAFEIALAMNSKSFKEAQTVVSFALMIPLLSVVVVPMLDLNTQIWMYAIPVVAEQTLLLELAKGTSLGFVPFLMAGGASLILTCIALLFATKRMKSERFVLGV